MHADQEIGGAGSKIPSGHVLVRGWGHRCLSPIRRWVREGTPSTRVPVNPSEADRGVSSCERVASGPDAPLLQRLRRGGPRKATRRSRARTGGAGHALGRRSCRPSPQSSPPRPVTWWISRARYQGLRRSFGGSCNRLLSGDFRVSADSQRRPFGLQQFSGGSLAKDLEHEPSGASERRDQAAHEGGWDLS